MNGENKSALLFGKFLLMLIFALLKRETVLDSVAQLVEQYTFNVWVLGSSPSGITKLRRKSGLFCFKDVSKASFRKRTRNKKANAAGSVALKSFELAQCGGKSDE